MAHLFFGNSITFLILSIKSSKKLFQLCLSVPLKDYIKIYMKKTCKSQRVSAYSIHVGKYQIAPLAHYIQRAGKGEGNEPLTISYKRKMVGKKSEENLQYPQLYKMQICGYAIKSINIHSHMFNF